MSSLTTTSRPNFLGEDGSVYLVRCFKCVPMFGRDNYGPAVATGTCAWCGYDGNADHKAWHDALTSTADTPGGAA